MAKPSLEENRSHAKAITNEIGEIDDRLEVAVEQFNQARNKLDDLRLKLGETRAKLSKAQADLRRSQNILNTRAAGIYMSGQGVDLLDVILSSRNLGAVIAAVDSLQRVSEQDAALLIKVKKDRLKVARAERTLAGQESAQASTSQSLASKKNQIQNRLADRQAALKQVKSDIAQRERELTALARAEAARTRVSAPSAAPMVIKDVPASGRGALVVKLALAQLGKPYVWAAAGPNSFDCSGLTQYVFAQVGVSLPHSAEAQFNMGRRVSREALQPGDLVFGGSGGSISHVGIYIGGGQYVHAPRTGEVVKISSLAARRNYVGAARF